MEGWKMEGGGEGRRMKTKQVEGGRRNSEEEDGITGGGGKVRVV